MRGSPSASRRGWYQSRRCRPDDRRRDHVLFRRHVTKRPEHHARIVCAAIVGPSWSRGATCFARPKSRIFSRPSAVTKMLSGLRSRWTMPCAWAVVRPATICNPKSTTRDAGNGPRSMSERSVSPSSSSVTRNGVSPTPTSKIDRTLGCESAAAARASCSNRERHGIPVPCHHARHHLDRDIPAEPWVARAVDFPHAAGAKCAGDLVRAKTCSCCQRHGLVFMTSADRAT